MTGEEHANMAAALLGGCNLGLEDGIEVYPAHEDGVNSIGNALAAAQVHATLALVEVVKALASKSNSGSIRITPLTESVSGPPTHTAEGLPTF